MKETNRKIDKLREGSRVPSNQTKKKVSRIWVIREICKKKYGTVRPTAIQINTVIRDWNLNKYTIDGKKRSKEMMKEAMSKAYASLV